MANARPPGGGETPQATIGIDYSQLRAAPRTAGELARATTREISQAFKAMQAEQRVLLEQQRQTTAVLRAQQAQISASTRAESSIRVTAARAEAQAQQQAARVAANAQIEEQRRVTAQLRSELRARESEQRAALRASGSVGGVGRGIAGAALGSLGGPVGAIAGAAAGGAVPIALGIAAAEAGRFALDAAHAASDVEESINKVGVAFDQNSRQILDWSESSAAALGQSRQQALEAASSFGLLFRTIGLGSQEAADMSEELVELATDMASINNISPDEALTKLRAGLVGEIEPLRTVGVLLNAAAVEAKALELGLANSTRSLTEQDKVMARYALILEQTTLTQGDFARTSQELANQERILAAEVSDLRAEFGELSKPIVEAGVQAGIFMARGLREWMRGQQRQVENYAAAWESVGRAMRQLRGIELPTVPGGPSWSGGGWSGGGAASGFGGGGGTGGFGGGPEGGGAGGLEPAQRAAINQRFSALNQVTRGEVNDVLDVTRQTSQQRATIVRQFETSSNQEAQDFARKRLNDERRHNMALLDIAQDSARQRVRWEAETARAINEARADRDERIGEATADSHARMADLEERYNRDRVRRQQDFGERLREAAASLNAVQVRELQRQQRQENEEAERARDEAIGDERASLQERIDDANKAFAKQEADQRAALQRRIDLQGEDDALRIEEMKVAFAEQIAQEDIERGIRLQRQAEQHAAQLAELDSQQETRIEQIRAHAERERAQIEEEFQASMVAAGYRLKAYEDYLAEREKIAIESFDRVYGHMINRFLTPLQGPDPLNPYVGGNLPSFAPPAPPSASSSSTTNSRNSTINIAPNALTVIAPPDMALDERTAAWFMGLLADFFEDYPQ